ncbi:MAG: hypothetical protein KDD00_14405 [Ignavibacteriae bacterium]|nr:hypothetical protein [Ignavibacteriota bacterium]
MNAEKLKFSSYKSMSVVQFRTDQINTFGYISLSEALKKKYAEIKEVSEAGSVNNLVFVNKSDEFIFLSDGDILSGAKQNRVLNTSVLAAPRSTVTIPVSCVEAGRWRYNKTDFTDSEYSAPAYMRSSKAKTVKNNLLLQKSFSANQSEVWEDVRSYENSMGFFSKTSNLSDVYENRKGDINDFIKSFKPEPEMNGMAVFIHNRLLNLEIFNRENIFSEYFSKLLRSAAFEAMNLKDAENKLTEAEALYKTNDFMDNISNLKFDIHKGVGAGEERRFESKDMTGFELSYDEKMIHFVALNLKKDENRILTDRNGRKILNFGKFKGRTIREIYRHDPEYIKWLCFESRIDADVKKEIYEEMLVVMDRNTI